MSQRVLFFMSSSSPVGGVETWLNRICEALPGLGYDPIVALARGAKLNDPERFRRYHPNLETIEVDGRGLPTSSRVLACLSAIRRTHPKIVVVQSLADALPAAAEAKVCIPSLRIVGVTHGLLSQMLADLEDYVSIFDMVVCPGVLNTRYLRDVVKIAGQRVRNIPYAAEAPERCRKQQSDDTPLRLAYIGRMTVRDKRATDLPHLYAALTSLGVPFYLRVVGDGPSRLDIEHQIGGAENVEFLGYLSHDEVYSRILPETDCLLSFSSSESFGISIIEAMMHGVVPISSRFLGLHSEGVVKDGVTGLTFPIGDVQACAELIRRVSIDRQLLHKLADNAKSLAEHRYSWDRCMGGLKQAFDDVVRLPRSISESNRKASRQIHGVLDRIGMPRGLVDQLRRLRRLIMPVVTLGDEEWPLFYRHHTPERLATIEAACQRLDRLSPGVLFAAS